MRKFSLFLLINLCLVALGKAQFEPIQHDDSYSVFMNLRAVSDDKVPVDIVPPIIYEDSAEFHMPKIIPGTYDIENYGEFLSEFKAFDSYGK